MRPQITIGSVQWSPQKAKLVELDIKRLLGESGVSPISVRFVDLDAPPDEAPPAPTYLHLKCFECDIQWYGETFSPCLRCGGKGKVHKATIQRVALPEGVVLGQIVEAVKA